MPSPATSPAGSSVDGTSSNTASTSSTGSVAMSSPNSSARRVLGARHLLGAVHERRHLARQHALRLALLGRRLRRRLELVDRGLLEKREVLEVVHDVAIVGVQPELVEPERRGPRADRARRARLRSCRTSRPTPSSQRQHQAVRLLRAQLANQIDAGRDVAPLIAAAHLQRAAVPIEELRGNRRPAAADS